MPVFSRRRTRNLQFHSFFAETFFNSIDPTRTSSLLTSDTIRLGVSVDPDGNDPCSSVVGTLTEVPPTHRKKAALEESKGSRALTHSRGAVVRHLRAIEP